jgi:hypothetical protein
MPTFTYAELDELLRRAEPLAADHLYGWVPSTTVPLAIYRLLPVHAAVRRSWVIGNGEPAVWFASAEKAREALRTAAAVYAFDNRPAAAPDPESLTRTPGPVERVEPAAPYRVLVTTIALGKNDGAALQSLVIEFADRAAADALVARERETISGGAHVSYKALYPVPGPDGPDPEPTEWDQILDRARPIYAADTACWCWKLDPGLPEDGAIGPRLFDLLPLTLLRRCVADVAVFDSVAGAFNALRVAVARKKKMRD